ncbi:MAG TPA: FAD-dependent oxidoreductase [Gammaproteobacteria bacterium]|nr:FAD-dependent oxidoreductase [Gammaproteobacteria bacterium]
MHKQPILQLQDLSFSELFHSAGLMRLDNRFMAELQAKHPDWHAQLLAYRSKNSQLGTIETSELLIRCATFLEEFLATLFHIEEAVAQSQAKTQSHNPLSAFKKYFVLRRAKKEIAKADNYPAFSVLTEWLNTELAKAPLHTADTALAVALLGTQYVNAPDIYAEQIEKLVQWCVRAMTTPEGRAFTSGWPSFTIPKRMDHFDLVATVPVKQDHCDSLAGPSLRLRDGFKLTDERMDARQVQDEVNYCIYCHDHEGDFCSKGFPVKKGEPTLGFKKNPLDTLLTGCPLEEKISEMHFLKKEGRTIASLAMIMIDNPMCPATGARICNDCMKACIYQKQDPVNIPQIETRVLTDVLDLPWGVEIYDLLTRWHPLRQEQWIMKPYNGLKVMIAGMGPAGFTLAHHLLLEGFAVVGFDGLKIEPLDTTLLTQPIYAYHSLTESLDERLMAGFGGVAEYGITVRWDKNFLKLIYLSLMRRPTFQVFGGVRFGGTLKVEDAWEMGFDHLAVAVGAGLPKALPIPGSMAQGMRQANDFLMALQLGNAAKLSSLTNLQIRLPAVVIGGGLTGVDTATEIQAYYIVQVEKILTRYEALLEASDEKTLEAAFDPHSLDILKEYLTHAKAIRAERALANHEKRHPDFIKLIHQWGGVTIAYRRRLQESPAYINNHEELIKALEEGIYYAEGLDPIAADLDENEHVQALICRQRIQNENKEWVTVSEEIRLPAKSILVATGTQPNTAYEFEHRGTFKRVNLKYQHYEDDADQLKHIDHHPHAKDPDFGPFTSYNKTPHRVSLIGDTHPAFHGSVVKAIASGMRTYPKILNLLKNRLEKGSETEYHTFSKKMNELFHASIIDIKRQTDSIIELTIHAPLATKHFEAGQFYRLQNLETHAPRIEETSLQMEPLALVAAECDKKAGTLTFIVAEKTATAKLCKVLKIGETVSLMGPTGVRAKIPTTPETILIIGNQHSLAFVRSYGKALRAAGHRVIYLGIFENKEEVYCQQALEAATDVIIWVTLTGTPITANRQTDFVSCETNIIQALLAYDAQHPADGLANIDGIFIAGNTDMLRTFQAARSTSLKEKLKKQPQVSGAVYGNMQCMLKGVCAQCLQWQIDPQTGQRTKAVFACSWQDQPLEIIDIDHVDTRQRQNRLHEQMNSLWIDHLFKNNPDLDSI